MNQAIDRVFKEAVAEGVFPAAELLVARGGEVLYASHYGDARAHACFDISSLTKPVSTATLAVMLAAEGLLKFDDTVYQWLAGAREPQHKQMTVRQLLEHTSGLPAWQPFFREIPESLIGTEAGKRIVLDSCYAEPLISEPGAKTLYSDLGYIILGEIVEQAGGAPLDALFMQMIARPLKLAETFFVRVMGSHLKAGGRRTSTTADQHVPTPKHNIKGERAELKEGEHRRFAPTEDCPWRERVIHGEVHDQNAYALGGVAGNAGLFSTASDLNLFVRELVKSLKGESNWLPKEILAELVTGEKAPSSGDRYVLGWNRPSRRNSAAGHHFSPTSIGHLGYTGCSVWIDLKADFWTILLTNRIHPSTTNEKIKAFRPSIHDLVYEELIKA
ncbi:MAG: serine hydrolase domain-containing protein [Pseudomonadota bacterium]